jgi:alanine racemase
MEQIRMMEGARLERPLEVFLKINTGMNRLGHASGGSRRLPSKA